MLVLGRKENQSIIIGDNIRVTIVSRSGSAIRIGVQAPRELRVLREELTTQGRTIADRSSETGRSASPLPVVLAENDE